MVIYDMFAYVYLSHVTGAHPRGYKCPFPCLPQRLNVNKKNTRFFNGIPGDGSLPDSCLFETFRQILDVRCEVAIVIVMVLIFAVFAMILIGLFIVYKKR